MDWNEQARSMLDSWSEAQRIYWEGWSQMMMGGPAMMTSLADQWNKMVEHNLKSWDSATDPFIKSTAENFFAAQGTTLRFLEFSARAWSALAPRFESGEDWGASVAAMLDKMRHEWADSPANLAAASQDVGELWRLYMEQWRSFGGPWEGVALQTPQYMGRAMTGDSSAMMALSELYRDAYQQTLGKLVTSPNLGMTRQLNARLGEGFDAWTNLQLATVEYNAMLAETWGEAFKKLMEDLVGMAERDEKITSVRDLLLLWTRGAEKIFVDTFQTEPYVRAQGKMLNAAMAYRLKERVIIEEFLKFYDLPTRTELDETHRRIYELRKEVKALRRELGELKNHPKGESGGAA